jgi:hypothetical protein
MKNRTPIGSSTAVLWLIASVALRAGELPEIEIFSIENIAAVSSSPIARSVFTTGQEWRITSITTYHWNNGNGAAPGMISLSESGGTTYGPWPTTGRAGQGGAPNAYWDATPDMVLPPGKYTVVDSDPSTWSQNTESGGRGFVSVRGRSQFEFPSDGALVSAIMYSVNGDPRVSPIVWTSPTADDTVNAQFSIPAASLQEGKNRLTFAAVGEGETETGPWVTGYVQRLPFADYRAGSLAVAVNRDPAEGADETKTVAPPANVAEVSITLPSGLTRPGLNHLHFRARDPAGFWGPMLISPLVQSPDPDLKVTEIAMAVNADPMVAPDASRTGADLMDVTLDLPRDSVPDGTQYLFVRARDQFGNWASMLIAPVLGEAADPLLGAGRIAGFEMQVLDAVGNPQAGPITVAVAPPGLSFDGIASWPQLRIRSSGDYRMAVATVSETGFPGPFTEASFQHVVSPFLESMNQDFWPPGDFPGLDLSFDGDTNGDGVANGSAFAYGVNSQSRALDRVPAARPDGEYLVFTFRQRAGGSGTPGAGYEVDGIRYMIEYATDLISPWSEASGVAELVGEPTANADGTETVSVRIPKPPGSGKLFARLRVHLAP